MYWTGSRYWHREKGALITGFFTAGTEWFWDSFLLFQSTHKQTRLRLRLIGGRMRIRSLALALAFVPGILTAQASSNHPTCKADRTGDRLLTSVEYPSGYRIDAPWVVVDQRTEASYGSSAIVVTAVLDRIIEYDPTTKERSVTPFPSAVEIVFEAETPEEVLEAAARVWCSTVAKVRSNRSDSKNGAAAVRMTSLPAWFVARG